MHNTYQRRLWLSKPPYEKIWLQLHCPSAYADKKEALLLKRFYTLCDIISTPELSGCHYISRGDWEVFAFFTENTPENRQAIRKVAEKIAGELNITLDLSEW